MNVGDERRMDFQSDVFRSWYRLVENLGGGVWRCERMPITDEMLDEMIADPYMSDDEIARQIDAVGTTFETRFVSSERWAAMF